MSNSFFKNKVIRRLFTYKALCARTRVCVCVCKQGLVLNNPQRLICDKHHQIFSLSAFILRKVI